MSEDLPYGTRGGTAIRHYFPLDGDYVVKIRLGKNFSNSRIRGITTREQIDVLLDGASVTRFSIGGECVDSEAPECERTDIYYRTSKLRADGGRGAGGPFPPPRPACTRSASRSSGRAC